jgi:hypothetical protein
MLAKPLSTERLVDDLKLLTVESRNRLLIVRALEVCQDTNFEGQSHDAVPLLSA